MDTTYLIWSAVLLWVMIMAAGLLKYNAWTLDGIKVMMSNREHVPEPSSLAKRADGAARNMIENLVLFTALLAAAHFTGKSGEQTALGAAVFFWARLVYWPVYLAGIQYLRTLIWLVAIIGLAIILFAIF